MVKTAKEMASSQREISVAAFFEKNRHLLGFDNLRKALMTTIKEAVDNALDACEEAGILPELIVEIIELSENKFRVIIEDNGPGIVKAQVPKIFAKLLYGSKFHKLSQTRGQQGIGISAAVMYAQLTTGKPTKIISKIKGNDDAYFVELHLDTENNKPEIVNEGIKKWNKEHGTRIELDLEASYQKGIQSIDEYLKQTAIANPHSTIIYTNPKAEQIIFARVTEKLPPESKEIKPHPYGIELGMLLRMLKYSTSKTLQSFLTTEFSRVSNSTAKEICENSKILPKTKPQKISRDLGEQLMNGIKNTKIMAPPTDCISPIGEELLEKGLRKEINAEFYTSITRPPAVYRGNPFIIEVALAYGGEQLSDKTARIIRFANRVPLLYQQSACATSKAISDVNWKSYGIHQTGSNLPVGPLTIVIHIGSVWVPFTSESKEAIANYDEIIKEIKLAVQECGRKLGSYINKKKRVGLELKKRSYIEKYIPHVASALQELLGLNSEENLKELLKEILEHERGTVDKVGVINNPEYDEKFAKIGREDESN